MPLAVFSVFGQQGSECANPIPAVSGPNVFSGTQNNDLWYTYTATQTGKITLSSCQATTDDTHVKVYPGSLCSPLNLKAESDGHCDDQSKVAFLATEGYDYLIVWTNKTTSNAFNWTLTEEEWLQGEICNNPIQATASASNECNHSSGTDQWFVYNAPGNGTLTLSSCGFTDLNTLVKVYNGCAGTLEAINDDDCNSQSEVSFDCTAGAEYRIVWDNVDASASYNWSLMFDGVPTNVAFQQKESVKVSPNPTNGLLNLTFTTDKDVAVTLSDMAGTLLKTFIVNEVNRTIDISEFPDGIYILYINIGKDKKVIKVVKR